jgi:protein translocase SecG subunit
MILPIAEIVVSIILVILILLQERSAGLSGIFGGETGFYQTRRGMERFIFGGTIVFAIIFVALALWQLSGR